MNYSENRNATSRFFDRMRISRYAAALIHEWDVSETTLVTFRTWWDAYQRYSRRQRGGGFGTLPTGPAAQTNQIENQRFYSFGAEPRIRHDWEWLDNTHTLTGGMMLYNTYSPRLDMQGEFLSGPNTGKTPQYLPDYSYRFGLIYNWRDIVKVAFMGNFVGSSFADDTNTASRFIPAYDVWDLTVEAKVYRDYVTVVGGVNNLFDRDYYARIRSDGIDPAMPRNWYAGIKVKF